MLVKLNFPYPFEPKPDVGVSDYVLLLPTMQDHASSCVYPNANVVHGFVLGHGHGAAVEGRPDPVPVLLRTILDSRVNH